MILSYTLDALLFIFTQSVVNPYMLTLSVVYSFIIRLMRHKCLFLLSPFQFTPIFQSTQILSEAGFLCLSHFLLKTNKSEFFHVSFLNVNIFWVLYSSMKVTSMSLGCERNKTLEDVILCFETLIDVFS